MDFTLLAFLAFATVTVVSAGAVISVRNPVHAALFLVLTFFTVACTWLLAGAEFLGIALILVYVGAVMVLFPVRGDDARRRHRRNCAKAMCATCRSASRWRW